MKPKYGDIRPSDGRVFTGYTKQFTKKYGMRKYAQWRSLESIKKNPIVFRKLIATIEAKYPLKQNVTPLGNTAMDYIAAGVVAILIAICIYVASR